MSAPRKSCSHRVAYACSVVDDADRRIRHAIICRDCGAYRHREICSDMWSKWIARNDPNLAWSRRCDTYFEIVAGPADDMNALRTACDAVQLDDMLDRHKRAYEETLSQHPTARPEVLEILAILHRAQERDIRARYAIGR